MFADGRYDRTAPANRFLRALRVRALPANRGNETLPGSAVLLICAPPRTPKRDVAVLGLEARQPRLESAVIVDDRSVLAGRLDSDARCSHGRTCCRSPYARKPVERRIGRLDRAAQRLGISAAVD